MAIRFPDPENTDEHGLLAIGGNLNPETLIRAYRNGIFPWFTHGQPILWWCPDPRMVLYPSQFRISHSLKQTLRNSDYHCTFDTAFSEVIRMCAEVKRKGQDGTWITPEMVHAYTTLHTMGLAHSVETWYKGNLAGGLYGLAIGKVFFGESMFHIIRDASKVALSYLVKFLEKNKFKIIDVQQSTSHLRSMGGVEIPRSLFLEQVRKAVLRKGVPGSWEQYSVQIRG